MAKKKRKLPLWLHGSAFNAVRGVMALPLVAGFDQAIDSSVPLAHAYAALNRKRTRRAVEHLRIAFPHWDAQRHERVAVAGYEHLFRLAVEFAYAPRLLTTDNWTRHVEVGPVAGAVQQVMREQPCLMITGHCGNWEVLGYTMGLLGFGMHALYRPLDLKPLDEWVRQTRQSRGLTLIDKFGAADILPRVLAPGGDRQGSPIGFVADQNAGDRGLFVPFFGRLASTYKTIGLLAIQYNATVICGMARRVPAHEPRPEITDQSVINPPAPPADWPNFRYRLESDEVIRPEDWKDQPDPVFYVTARYRRAIETMVRSAPEQYLWMHRIWKSRPRHERLNRPFPAALKDKLKALPWMTDEELERIIENSRRDTLEIASRTPEPDSAAEPEPSDEAMA